MARRHHKIWGSALIHVISPWTVMVTAFGTMTAYLAQSQTNYHVFLVMMSYFCVNLAIYSLFRNYYGHEFKPTKDKARVLVNTLLFLILIDVTAFFLVKIALPTFIALSLVR